MSTLTIGTLYSVRSSSDKLVRSSNINIALCRYNKAVWKQMLTSNFSFGGIVQIVSLVQPVTVTTKKTPSIAQWTKHTEKERRLSIMQYYAFIYILCATTDATVTVRYYS
jgi:hypothetical protein